MGALLSPPCQRVCVCVCRQFYQVSGSAVHSSFLLTHPSLTVQDPGEQKELFFVAFVCYFASEHL